MDVSTRSASIRTVTNVRRHTLNAPTVNHPSIIAKPVWLMTNESMVAIGPINCLKSAIQKVHGVTDFFYENSKHNVELYVVFLRTTAVVGFKCPAKVDSNSPAARFWPFPRFAIPGDSHHLITCVEGFPRLISCGEDKLFNEHSLTCEEIE